VGNKLSDSPKINTSIWLSLEERQLLRVAGAIFNLAYQPYMRKVALEHARATVLASNIVFKTATDERIVFENDDEIEQ
jgi:hypothetical protein